MTDIAGECPALDDLLQLDKQLCFALYVSSKEIIRSYQPFLRPLNLTYTGYITMLALWEKDNVTVKSLGERLTLDSGTLTPLLKKLEQLEYIERVRSHEDERSVLIRLTDSGRALKERAAGIPQQVFSAFNIDASTTEPLVNFLHRLSCHLFTNRPSDFPVESAEPSDHADP